MVHISLQVDCLIAGSRTSAERFGFDAKVDADAKLLLSLFEHGDHDLWSVVDREDNVLDTGL